MRLIYLNFKSTLSSELAISQRPHLLLPQVKKICSQPKPTEIALLLVQAQQLNTENLSKKVKLDLAPSDSETYVYHHLPTNRAKSQNSKFEDLENLLLLYSLFQLSNWILILGYSHIGNLTYGITIAKDISLILKAMHKYQQQSVIGGKPMPPFIRILTLRPHHINHLASDITIHKPY